jgi:hypothetical protein
MLTDGRDASPTCKFNINACEPINSTSSCPHARIFFASDDSNLKANALNWWAPNCINTHIQHLFSLTDIKVWAMRRGTAVGIKTYRDAVRRQ